MGGILGLSSAHPLSAHMLHALAQLIGEPVTFPAETQQLLRVQGGSLVDIQGLSFQMWGPQGTTSHPHPAA